MARKPATRAEFALFDVVYEDGSQRSNRRVPSEILVGLDGDAPARAVIEEQDRLIAEKSGNPVLAVKSIRRSNGKWADQGHVAAAAVVCDPQGVTDFDALRSAMAHRQAPGVFLFAFDLIELDGQDLRREPWTARREALAALLHRLVLVRKPPEAWPQRLTKLFPQDPGDCARFRAAGIAVDRQALALRPRQNSAKEALQVALEFPSTAFDARLRLLANHLRS
jgi:hypothetical protein